MSEFVAECRSEWKRLGVPDPVADEMAAELAADLEEAEADGAPAEDLLGSGAFDARAFAAAWAAERGVTPQPPPGRDGRRSRARLLAAIGGAFALIAIAGAALVIVASPSAPGRLALESRSDPPAGAFARVRGIAVSPDGTRLAVVGPDGLLLFDAPMHVEIGAVPTAQRIIVRAPPPIAVPAASSPWIVAVDIDDSDAWIRALGWVLLAVGLAGLASSTMFWLWAHQGRPTSPAYWSSSSR